MSCEKFLDERSDKKLSIPVTLEEFKALINNSNYINSDFIAAGEVSSDDYYLSDQVYNALQFEGEKRLYTWQSDNVTRPFGMMGDEWYNCYQAIYFCNSIIHGIEENGLSGPDADNLKGQALTLRAARFLDGLQVWSKAYNSQTADSDLGMVLRVDPDINQMSTRSSVQETYDLIIRDLSEAVGLLYENSPVQSLPGKDAAYGLLARAHLYMGDYENALQYTNKALSLTKAKVIDFNELDPSLTYPIPVEKVVSREIVLTTTMYAATQLRVAYALITPELYSLYEDADLRKVIYFGDNGDGTYRFRGMHSGNSSKPSALTISELLLIRAECSVRLGMLEDGAEAINSLMENRWKAGEFVPYQFLDTESALEVVLQERRRELVMRGLRWVDIKRLNRDGHNIVLRRRVNGESYELLPNDLRYAIAIPETVIELSNIEQNPR